MSASLVHRGPDDGGEWIDSEASYAVAHRRLAVLDLSPAGHQPMVSHSGRFVLAFNGEIYNHQALRREIAAEQGGTVALRGHSDTETLLAACEAWGLEEALKRAVGMFALALWDRRERTLSLVRDRMGEKPLYYGWCRDAFVFGSELKAFSRFPGFEGEVSRNALALFLRFAYVPAPYSIFNDIYKLEPGCVMRVSADGLCERPVAVPRAPGSGEGWRIRRYWSLREQVQAGRAEPISDEHEALEQLDAAVRESARLQSIADVPLGAFLSGGVDSSLVVAAMQAESGQPVRTFTIGFDDENYSEAEHAAAVARHLGTEHNELRVSPGEALNLIPNLPDIYDEPFADSSQMPTFLVAQMAREHVTVALSGDGGDELFGGYNRYGWVPGIRKGIGWVPSSVRALMGKGLERASRLSFGGRSGAFERLARERGVALVSEKMQKLGRHLEHAGDVDDLYRSLVSQWKAPLEVVRGAASIETLIDGDAEWPNLGSPEERMMYLDSMTYLPDDILCKVDRAAMAVSLETRVPLLDHRVVELAWRIPLNMKMRNGQGKWILRQLLYRYVPRDLIERPKQGFAVPLDDWLRGPLREWCEELLSEHRLREEGFFNAEPIRARVEDHMAGRRNHGHELWAVLMFQAWRERWGAVA